MLASSGHPGIQDGVAVSYMRADLKLMAHKKIRDLDKFRFYQGRLTYSSRLVEFV